MAANDPTGEREHRLIRNLLAGLAGLAAAAAFVIVTALQQEYSSVTFVRISLFVFPTPVACGLAVGLVSPRRAIVWAPLWASIFALSLFALLSGSLLGLVAAFSAGPIAYMLGGAALAALAGLVGQLASVRGWAGRVVAAFLVLCCLMAVAEYALLAHQMSVFRRERMPGLLAQVGADYIQLPAGLNWRVQRRQSGCYGMRARHGGRELLILVRADKPNLIALKLSLPGDRAQIRSTDSARRYLASIGIKDALLGSLSRSRGAPGLWRASFGGTSLTLASHGDVALRPLPGFED